MHALTARFNEECDIAELRRLLNEQGLALVESTPGDSEGRQLRQLVGQLGTAEQHDRLGRIVWHIRYDALAAARGATPSLTMEPLPFHTDGAFDDPSPRYLAQYVVQEDRFGGGETLLVAVDQVRRRLSDETLTVLTSTCFRFYAPAEYNKGLPYRDAPILFGDGLMRYRREIIDEEFCLSAIPALDELDKAISDVKPLRLQLPSGTILLLDNARFLHARTEVRDPERHLLRMRFSGDAR